MILQRTPEWYTARLGKFTASCFHELLSRPSDPNAIWSKSAIKCIERAALQIWEGQYHSTPDNVATRWGVYHEPLAIEAYAKKTGYVVNEAGFMLHQEINDAGATPDAMVLCTETGQYVPLQVKCHYNRQSHADYIQRMHTGEDLKKIKSQYYCQVQGEIWVTGADYGWFVSFDPRMEEHRKVHYVKVSRDEQFIRLLREKVLDAVQFRERVIEQLKINGKILS
jgi:hypothetical protein